MMKTMLMTAMLASAHCTAAMSENSSGPRGLAVPTAAQLQWAQDGYGAFIHYNMGTYVSTGGGCSVSGSRRERRLDPNLFAPTQLDTDQWLELIAAYGGKVRAGDRELCRAACTCTQ